MPAHPKRALPSETRYRQSAGRQALLNRELASPGIEHPGARKIPPETPRVTWSPRVQLQDRLCDEEQRG